MNDPEVLFKFIKENAPPGAPNPRALGGRFRDLRTLDSTPLATPISFASIRAACKFDTSRERAASAVVLASASVHRTSAQSLMSLYKTMYGLGFRRCVEVLQDLMTENDTLTTVRPNVTLKNFMSAGYDREEWTDYTLHAYAEAGAILGTAYGIIEPGAPPRSERVHAIFRKYFGHYREGPFKNYPARYTVRANELVWRAMPPGSPPLLRGVVTHGDVVWEVLHRLKGYLSKSENIRFCLGGITSNPQIGACLGKSIQPIEIHLGRSFFDDSLRSSGLSRSYAVIHALTLKLGYIADHFNGEAFCTGMALATPRLALSNADNYALFLHEAFGKKQ